MNKYWAESVKDALEDAGALKLLSSQQVEEITEAIISSRDNESLMSGVECIPNPLEAEVRAVTKSREDAAATYEARLVNREKVIEDLRDECRRLENLLALGGY